MGINHIFSYKSKVFIIQLKLATLGCRVWIKEHFVTQHGVQNVTNSEFWVLSSLWVNQTEVYFPVWVRDRVSCNTGLPGLQDDQPPQPGWSLQLVSTFKDISFIHILQKHILLWPNRNRLTESTKWCNTACCLIGMIHTFIQVRIESEDVGWLHLPSVWWLSGLRCWQQFTYGVIHISLGHISAWFVSWVFHVIFSFVHFISLYTLGSLRAFKKPLPYSMYLFNLRIANHILIKIF